MLAGAFVNERELLEWLLDLVFREDGLYFRGVAARVEARGSRRLHVVYQSRGPALPRPFGLVMAGILESIPRLVGRPHAHVVPRLGPKRITLDVTLGRRRPIASVWRRLLRRESRHASDELRAIYDELVIANQQLVEKLAELETSRATRRELESRLAQFRRMQMIGRFAGAVAHEFNNHLTVIATLASFLAGRVEDTSPAWHSLTAVEEVAGRAAALTRELRGLGAGEPSDAAPVDLRRVCEEALPLVRTMAGDRIAVTMALGQAPAGVRIDPGQAERVLVNLVVNAKEAMQQGGHVTIAVRAVELDEAFVARHPGASVGAHVLLCVQDDGPGMSEEVRARVFEPLFSTKRDIGGTGLGLATVYAVVKGAGGTVWVDSTPGEGATFRVYLPRAALDSSPKRATRPLHVESGPTRDILFVDDDAMIRAATHRILDHAGYDVTLASSGDHALELVRSGFRPDIVVSDVVMPGLRGLPLVEALRGELGAVPVLFVSGYTDRVLEAELGPDTELLAKPYRTEELLGRIVAMLRANDLEAR